MDVVKFCVCPSFLFDTEGGVWDVIVLIPDHCLSTYFTVCFLPEGNKQNQPLEEK